MIKIEADAISRSFTAEMVVARDEDLGFVSVAVEKFGIEQMIDLRRRIDYALAIAGYSSGLIDRKSVPEMTVDQAIHVLNRKGYRGHVRWWNDSESQEVATTAATGARGTTRSYFEAIAIAEKIERSNAIKPEPVNTLPDVEVLKKATREAALKEIIFVVSAWAIDRMSGEVISRIDEMRLKRLKELRESLI